MDNLFPQPQPDGGLNVRSVQITEPDGVREQVSVVTGDYQMIRNDRYIVCNTAAVATVTLADVDIGKAVTITSKNSDTITIAGGNHLIDGAASTSTTTAKSFFFASNQWNEI